MAAADKAIGEVLDYLSAGLANAANFIRPNRLVLASELTRYPAFNSALLRSIREKILPLGDDMSFLPGHGPGSTIGEERASNPFLR